MTLCQCPGAYQKALLTGDEAGIDECPKCGLSRIVEVFRTVSRKQILWTAPWIQGRRQTFRKLSQ